MGLTTSRAKRQTLDLACIPGARARADTPQDETVMTMTPRDRMRAVLRGELPDRVPFLPTIAVDHACVACGKPFEEALANPALGQECMLGAARRYQTDAVRFSMGPDASWYEEKAVVERDGRLAQISRQSGRLDGYFDVEGGGKLHCLVDSEPMRTVGQVRDLPVTVAEEIIQRGRLKDVALQVRAAHDEGLFVVGVCPGQTLNFMVEQMAHPEAALLLFLDDPPLALALIDKAVAIAIEVGKALIQTGVDCLYIGDSYASASVISPQVYERFCAPAYTEVAQEFHRAGVFCYKHCCGNYNPLLEYLPRVGVDAMDGLDPTSGMEVAACKERIGESMSLLGGLNCLTLLNGSPEEVYEDARRCVTEGRPGGRYILGSGCAVPRYTPTENVMTARRAAVELGSYV